MPTAYDALVQRLNRLDALRQSAYLLEWDQHTFMPAGGTPARSIQTSALATLSHEIFTAPETGKLLAQAEREATLDAQKAQLRETRWAFDRATLVPHEVVEQISMETSACFPKWVEAKKRSDYKIFQPHLEKLVELRKKYAAAIDPNAPAYSVLFNDYEPWIPLADARRTLSSLREGLRPLIQRAAEQPAAASEVFAGAWPADKQMELAKRLVALVGYDFQHGRLDVSPHPFSMGNAFDARITTRFEQDSPLPGLLAALHEAGHAMYMQGLPKEHYGTPLGDARDLVVHESQSRLWENHVGRSLPFWEKALPLVQSEFPEWPGRATPEQAWRAVNRVRPSFIRVYADELTYHMHIALRFEIEEAMMSGAIRVNEVPAVWNDLMEKYLGIRPKNDAEGCLQDMHWSGASFGYFPTYSLGSILSAQLHAAYSKQSRASPTDYAALKTWLVENVHKHGKLYKTMELVERATGAPLSHEPFLAYAREKYAKVWA